jgi:putative phosphoserine phosphatase/1-acylglycerol-3-phosphate O-acyltransferase
LVIFDVDGTLIKGTSCEKLFFHHLLDTKKLGFKNLINICLRGIALSRFGKSHIISANKGYLRGFEVDYINKLGKDHFLSYVKNRISRKGIDKINYHKNKSEKIALLSGMPEFLLKNFSDYLEIEQAFGSVLHINNGKYTGHTEGVFPLGKGKVKIVESFFAEYSIFWPDITAYADHHHDRFLLEKVGKPIAVNPNNRLKKIAEKNNWPIEIFD